MTQPLKDYSPDDVDVTTIFDDSDGTYDYYGVAPQRSVRDAATDGQDEAIWYIERTTKVAPFITEKASPRYDQIWDNRGSITSYA